MEQMNRNELNVLSVARMVMTLGSGIGFLIYLHTSTVTNRPDITDLPNRVHDTDLSRLQTAYDFVIVGGGSAGCVVANRLSEYPEWTVLLLEAGPDEITLTDMPLMFPTLQLSPLDWQFKTESGGTAYCRAMTDGRCNWPRGRVLGGSSVLNAMLYVRGNRRDYDHWSDLGNPGWSYSEVLPYFKKAEDLRIPNDPPLIESQYHGSGGYLSVEYFRYYSPMTEWFLEAARQFGYGILDVNGRKQTGFTRAQGTLRDGLRCSTAKAYLRPVSKRPNLFVSLHSYVTKIVLDGDGRRACAVEFEKFAAIKRTVYARREIVLSAGTIQTPQLLMLSGIGPFDHLQMIAGIQPRINLNGVGRNLQDHVALGGHTFLFVPPPDQYGPDDMCGFQLPKVFSTEVVNEFIRQRTGPMYWLPECEVIGFVHSPYANRTDDWPDLQYMLTTYADNTDGGLFGKRAAGLTDNFYSAVYEPILYRDAFDIIVLLMRPKSRGRIFLRSSDPKAPPLIQPNYYDDPDDLKVMVAGAQMAYEFATSPYMRTNYNTSFNPYKIPECVSDAIFMSDTYWACQARQYTLTIYHPVGTCKMGSDTDSDAVVDHRLRVKNVENLRIIDGSIMPFITTGNTNAPIIMIAEKGSDMIKEDQNQQRTATSIGTRFPDDTDDFY